jgi:hypothetical protein
MRRLIAYCNALFLGVILGMIFIAIVHATPTHRPQSVRANGSGLVRLVLHARETCSLR